MCDVVGSLLSSSVSIHVHVHTLPANWNIRDIWHVALLEYFPVSPPHNRVALKGGGTRSPPIAELAANFMNDDIWYTNIAYDVMCWYSLCFAELLRNMLQRGCQVQSLSTTFVPREAIRWKAPR